MPKAQRKTRHLETSDQSGVRRENPVKRWCFTINNPRDEDMRHIREMLTEVNCDFAIVGREVGENGTPHLQGFVNMKVKRRLTPRNHFESARGSDLQK